MSKKIMIIKGSPRKDGNTAAVVKWVLEGINEEENEITVVDAAKLMYKTHGCIACMGCQRLKTYECVMKDEAHGVLKNIPNQDLVVFASPVYFMGFTAQIKHIIDRMFSLVKFNEDHSFTHPMDKTDIALILTGGGGIEDGLLMTEQNMVAIAAFFKKEIKKLIVPYAPMDPDDILKDNDLKEKSIAFGKELAD